jgi:hypothetical protein
MARTKTKTRTNTKTRTKLKTRPTGASVENYLASRANERQRADCQKLMALLKKITRKRPHMWGQSIVGFGSFRYTYASGHSGQAPLAGFAIRGRDLVVYLAPAFDARKALLARLGKHTMGVSCLYFRQLADIDVSVLEQLVVASITDAKQRYG